MDLTDEEIPPELQKPFYVFGRFNGAGLPVELLEPRLCDADEVDNLQILSVAEIA